MFIHHEQLSDVGLKQPVYFCYPCWDLWRAAPLERSQPLDAIDADERKHHIKHLKNFRALLEQFLGRTLT